MVGWRKLTILSPKNETPTSMFLQLGSSIHPGIATVRITIRDASYDKKKVRTAPVRREMVNCANGTRERHPGIATVRIIIRDAFYGKKK